MNQKQALAFIVALCCVGVEARQVFEGEVASVEPTYLPTRVTFTMKTGNATCPAGNWLTWKHADASNNKAVYATLLTAMSAGKKVRFYMNDFDATCTGTFIHLLD